MRKSLLIAALMLPLVSAAGSGACVAPGTNPEVYGFSSEEFGSSSSSSYLGVDTRDITPDRLGALHLKEEQGVEVTLVDQDAPAGKAGVKEHDVILTLNGEKVESVEQLRRMIRETPSGRVVTLGISRDGQPLTIKVQLADRQNSYSYSFGPKAKEFHFEMPNMPNLPDFDMPVSIVVVHSSVRSGLMVENLTPQLGDFFGGKNGEGVLVRSVEKGSRADKAGFRAGDVIVKINGEPIHDSGDFSHALRSRRDNTAKINILRDRKEQSITLTLPERGQSGHLRESADIPEIKAEMVDALSEAKSEIADIMPDVQEAVRTAELERVKPEIERSTRELRKQRVELKKELRELQREFEIQQRELKEELRDRGEF